MASGKKNISVLVTIGAALSSTVSATFGGMDKRIAKLGASLKSLKKNSGDITRLQTAQSRLAAANKSGNADRIEKEQRAVARLSESLRRAGIDTNNLAREQTRLSASIATTEAAMGRATRSAQRIGQARKSFAGIGSAVRDLKSNIAGIGTTAAVVGGTLGYFFKTQFIDTAAEFERLQTVLKTLEGGDVKKAKQAFGWISKFAADTPYELEEVTSAFVKLRAYGIDPIAGDTLRVLGDTSSAMGKTLMDSIEAVSDAITGENERLKEFGIKGAKKNGQIIYSYTNRAGKQLTKTVDANNRAQIMSTLKAIWNEKYQGAMKEQSKTWIGMMSNLGDQWKRFTSMVMASGPFDWLKQKAGAALEFLNKAAEDGRMQKWAEDTGKAIKDFAVEAYGIGKSIAEMTVTVKDFVGGWKNLGLIIGGVALAPTAISVGRLGVSLVRLVPAIAGCLGPWGLLATAVVTAGVAIHQNWGGIGDWFRSNVYLPLAEMLDDMISKIKEWDESLGASKWWKENMFSQEIQNSWKEPVGRGDIGEEAAAQAKIDKIRPPVQSVLMPEKQNPAAPPPKTEQQINNDIKLFITTPPGAKPEDYGKAVKNVFESKNLYDAAASLGAK